MSRTDKTKPFWVKLMHGDLAVKEWHDHADGVCDMPPADRAVEWKPGQRCRREFFYTGTRVCCCDMCHWRDWPETEQQRRRKERRRAWQQLQGWRSEYE